MEGRRIEVWGGVECTLARVRDKWRDEVVETGHRDRPEDLDAIRALGIETLRYPVLMEMVAPDHPDRCDWRWSDERFARMRRLGLRPIAGLLHHGSGPGYTSLLDPALPRLLADFAGKVARRYPWIDRFTPVNEPLTTARFSALYGHWYPHAADFGRFLRALVIECKATVLAMRAIRAVNPGAQLVQTEDIGRTFNTAALQAQADHENERRWLSLDLLCGRVDGHHAWDRVLRDHGIAASDLDLFREGDGMPDLIGVNHYLTSERYLDEDRASYPEHLHGHNGRQAFADAEAVRIRHLPQGSTGPAARLREVWSRYGLPMAVTEVHHGCTREEQLRWLSEVCGAANQVRQEGADLRAVTVWALFGGVDWSSLLREKRGSYEPGAFDIRAPAPRPTALAAATRSLARTGRFAHPVLQTSGWWHRTGRFYDASAAESTPSQNPGARPLLICGGPSPLAEAFARVGAVRGLHHAMAPGGPAASIAALALIDTGHAWAVIDTGSDGLTRQDRAQGAARTSRSLALACARSGTPFVTFSTDQVFDGRRDRPYLETDDTDPVGIAGRSLVRHEQDVAAAHPAALIVRTGALLSAWDPGNLGLRLLLEAAGGRLPPWGDLILSPAYTPDLAHTVLDLLIDGATGIWHLPNQGRIRMSDLALRLAAAAGLQAPSAPLRPPVRRNFSLASCKGWPMPTLDDALSRFGRDALAEQRPGLIAAE